MQIISSDFKKGKVQLKIDDIEDLWYLSHLIDTGDFVKSKTTRKLKIGDSENATVVKKTLVLSIEAETIEFGAGGNSVRINGKVQEGPEDVPKGSYHALSLEEGSEFLLEKVQWREYQKQKLKEAAEKKYNYLFCLFDREEVLFALSKKAGYLILVKLKGDVPKKGRDNDVKKDFHQEIIKALEIYTDRHNPEAVILASPAFYKEDLFKKITNEELKRKIVLATCSDISESSLDEVVKRPELANILKSSRDRNEKLIVEELLSEINKNNLAAYGWEETKKMTEIGAVSKLLLTDSLIQQKKEKGTFTELDSLMKAVDSLQGEIYILSSDNESGKKLNGLGGIAALLRYKIH